MKKEEAEKLQEKLQNVRKEIDKLEVWIFSLVDSEKTFPTLGVKVSETIVAEDQMK